MKLIKPLKYDLNQVFFFPSESMMANKKKVKQNTNQIILLRYFFLKQKSDVLLPHQHCRALALFSTMVNVVFSLILS